MLRAGRDVAGQDVCKVAGAGILQLAIPEMHSRRKMSTDVRVNQEPNGWTYSMCFTKNLNLIKPSAPASDTTVVCGNLCNISNDESKKMNHGYSKLYLWVNTFRI